MSSRRSWQAAALGVLAMAVSVGCTRSIDVTYTPSLYRLPRAEQLQGVVLGIGRLEDRRAWVERSDPETQGYFMLNGPWRFGHLSPVPHRARLGAGPAARSRARLVPRDRVTPASVEG